MTLDEALAVVEKLSPKLAFFTHTTSHIDYSKIERSLPKKLSYSLRRLDCRNINIKIATDNKKIMNTGAQKKPKAAVVLSGCGVFDGTEIHEAVITLLCLLKGGAEVSFFLPRIFAKATA